MGGKSASGSAVEGATGMLISIFMPRSTAVTRGESCATAAEIFAGGLFLEHSPARSVPRTDIGSLNRYHGVPYGVRDWGWSR